MGVDEIYHIHSWIKVDVIDMGHHKIKYRKDFVIHR